MTRIYGALAALLILVSVLAGLVAWGRQGHKSAQEAQEKAKVMATQLEASDSALRAYKRNAEVERAVQQKRAQVAEQRRATDEAQDKEVRRALQDHRDWAAQPIPDSVLRALDGADGIPNPGAPSARGAGAGLPNPGP